MGLDDSRLGGLCTTLIALDPLPSRGEIYSELSEKSNVFLPLELMNKDRKLLVLPLVESKEFRVRQCKVTEGWNTQSFGPKSASCSHCGRTGHEKKDCWQIIGFPEWWTECNGGGRGTSSRGRGGHGSGRG